MSPARGIMATGVMRDDRAAVAGGPEAGPPGRTSQDLGPGRASNANHAGAPTTMKQTPTLVIHFLSSCKIRTRPGNR